MSISEKYISEAFMKDKPKIPIGLFLRDKSVTTRKLVDKAVTEEKLADDAVTTDKIKNSNVTTLKIADKNITTEKIADQNVTTEKIADNNVTTEKIRDNAIVTDKIKDHNVTWDKLTPEAQKVIEAGTGVNGDLVHDMEQWNNRIATLESAKLQPKTIIEATDVVEWTDNNTAIPVNISLQDEQGHIDNDSNYTDKQLLYSYQNYKETSTQGKVLFNISFNNPNKVTIAANGYAKYKGVNVIFPYVTKTVYAVLPSYIGYVDSVDNWNKNGQKLIKHSLNGSYNVTNSFKGNAYLVVAIPKNSAVDSIHTIVQHGMLDARQSVSTYEKDDYTLYVCETAHNPGTYNFIIS